jgi:hypothetical protein
MGNLETGQPWSFHQIKVCVNSSRFESKIENQLTFTFLLFLLAELADAMFALGKPVVLVLQGGRPFAIPEYYNKSAAVLNTVSSRMLSNYTRG